MSAAVQFYTRDPGPLAQAPASVPTEGFHFELWRPSLARPFAPGRRDPRVLSYSLFHALGRFANRDYGMGLLRTHETTIAHSSLIMPGFFRFPFMGPDDLQIGATQTSPRFRGKGLAVRAITEIIRMMGHDRRYWYLTDATNAPSIAVIRKAGFRLAGTGGKRKAGGPAYYEIADQAPLTASEESQPT